MTTTTAPSRDVVYEGPPGFPEVPMRYCPGCTHGIAHRLVAEALAELGVRERAVAVASVGCSVYAYEYFNNDAVQAAHGRAPAVAMGIKRARPDAVVFTYQGDGDLAAIGLNEVLQSAARADNITVIFVNNAVYGMTRGQMAPTTLMGQKTTTTPQGRTVAQGGNTLNVCELLNVVPGVTYLAREALCDPQHVLRARRSILKAFRAQLDGLGFSLVELLSTCPAWWHMDPLKSLAHIREQMMPQFPLKVFRDPYAEGDR
jgi:2-oxoglutarate/2-oxoacid ferredoxin oxidoreductase subunit beta